MHKILLTLVGGISWLAASAQSSPDSSMPLPVLSPAPLGRAPGSAATRADTVQALHHLFAKHRTGGWVWTTIGGLFTVRIAAVAAASSSSGSLSSSPGGTLVGIGLFGGVPAGIGVGKLTRFSKTREAQTVALYDKSGILPPYVGKRLRKKYFLR